MKKFIVIVIVSFLLLGAQSYADVEFNEESRFIQTAQNTLQSTVRIGLIDHGSGFYVSDNLIVTNYHVIKNLDKITFKTHDGKRCFAKLVYQEDSLDLALLSTECEGKPLEITEAYTMGQSVMTVGNPDVYDFTITRGIVSGQKWDMIQTDARVSSGSSGGALVDMKGNVIGVIVAKDKTYDYIGFAISGKEVNKFIERAK